MRILPWFREEYHSPLAPAEVLRRVRGAAGLLPPTEYSISKIRHDFKGNVADSAFTIQLLGTITKSPVLALSGHISETTTGSSRLHLTFRLALGAALFMVIWFGFSCVATLFLLHANWLQDTGNNSTIAPVIVFAFGLALVLLPFWLEVNQLRMLLTNLLRLKPVSPA